MVTKARRWLNWFMAEWNPPLIAGGFCDGVSKGCRWLALNFLTDILQKSRRPGKTGWVSVGIDHDTAEFAVETLRRWWREMGSALYPDAKRTLP